MRRHRGIVGFLLVAALAAAACSGSGSAASSAASATPTVSASATPTPTSTVTPEPTVEVPGLTAHQPSSWKADPRTWIVVISWDAPTGFETQHYVVQRDGKVIGGDVVGKTLLKDDSVEPGTTYHYSVYGVDASGTLTKTSTAVVKTGTPSVEDARLEGKFVAKLHITSQSNLQGGAQGGGVEFIFDPTCKSGACSVRVSIRGASQTAVLSRSGASYTGTLHAPFRVQSCSGGTIVETLALNLRVVKAQVTRGGWRASTIEGTMNETSSSGGCLTAHINYRVSAVILG